MPNFVDTCVFISLLCHAKVIAGVPELLKRIFCKIFYPTRSESSQKIIWPEPYMEKKTYSGETWRCIFAEDRNAGKNRFAWGKHFSAEFFFFLLSVLFQFFPSSALLIFFFSNQYSFWVPHFACRCLKKIKRRGKLKINPNSCFLIIIYSFYYVNSLKFNHFITHY